MRDGQAAGERGDQAHAETPGDGRLVGSHDACGVAGVGHLHPQALRDGEQDQAIRGGGVPTGSGDQLGDQQQGWFGEIAGLEVSLAAANDKLTAMNRLAERHGVVHLGMPDFRQLSDELAILRIPSFNEDPLS